LNIFYLSHDPAECARFHVNRHSTKMVLEYAQLLSTAHRVLDGNMSVGLSDSGRKKTSYILPDQRNNILYSATHINHPSAMWVRKTHQNYIWLTELLEELCCEYTYRYEKTHKVERDGLLKVLRTNLPANIPIGPFTAPTPAMPDDVKVPGNSLASYRNYYNKNKTHLADWKKRPVPQWFQA
jgi:hypothetical protein